MRRAGGFRRAHWLCLYRRLVPERILHAARTAALIASGSGESDGCGISESRSAQFVSGGVALGGCRDQRQSRAGDAGRQSGARLRSAHSGSARELCRRIAKHSGGRIRRNFCRRFPAAGAHECIMHREDDGEFGAWHLGRWRTRSARFLLRREDSGIFCQRIGAAGHSSTGCARSSGRRNGSGAGAGMAGSPAA